MALTASLGVLLGMKKGALFGLIMGLIVDVLYSPMVGLSAMGYMFAGLLGGRRGCFARGNLYRLSFRLFLHFLICEIFGIFFVNLLSFTYV